MERQKVYNAIDTERVYQDRLTMQGDRPDMVVDMPLSSMLLAMDVLLETAKAVWYRDAAPYEQTMPLVRKIAAMAVKAGEKYGMPDR